MSQQGSLIRRKVRPNQIGGMLQAPMESIPASSLYSLLISSSSYLYCTLSSLVCSAGTWLLTAGTWLLLAGIWLYIGLYLTPHQLVLGFSPAGTWLLIYWYLAPLGRYLAPLGRYLAPLGLYCSLLGQYLDHPGWYLSLHRPVPDPPPVGKFGPLGGQLHFTTKLTSLITFFKRPSSS